MIDLFYVPLMENDKPELSEIDRVKIRLAELRRDKRAEKLSARIGTNGTRLMATNGSRPGSSSKVYTLAEGGCASHMSDLIIKHFDFLRTNSPPTLDALDEADHENAALALNKLTQVLQEKYPKLLFTSSIDRHGDYKAFPNWFVQRIKVERGVSPQSNIELIECQKFIRTVLAPALEPVSGHMRAGFNRIDVQSNSPIFAANLEKLAEAVGRMNKGEELTQPLVQALETLSHYYTVRSWEEMYPGAKPNLR